MLHSPTITSKNGPFIEGYLVYDEGNNITSEIAFYAKLEYTKGSYGSVLELQIADESTAGYLYEYKNGPAISRGDLWTDAASELVEFLQNKDNEL